MSCVEGEGSGKMTTMAAKEKSSFAVTCGLLSRYLREKKGGALQGLSGLDMAPPAAAVGGAFHPPTTMNLLSGLEEPRPKPNAVDVELAVDKVQLLLKAPTGNQDAENTR
jgi:jasmonate ZIM domain-containing protein